MNNAVLVGGLQSCKNFLPQATSLLLIVVTVDAIAIFSMKKFMTSGDGTIFKTIKMIKNNTHDAHGFFIEKKEKSYNVNANVNKFLIFGGLDAIISHMVKVSIDTTPLLFSIITFVIAGGAHIKKLIQTNERMFEISKIMINNCYNNQLLVHRMDIYKNKISKKRGKLFFNFCFFCCIYFVLLYQLFICKNDCINARLTFCIWFT